MSRAFREPRLVVASHNAGKLREIADLLRPFGVETVSAAELGLPEPEETETTFEGNARLKAHAAARASGLPALSDDSGLAVEALGGEPGIYSARWAETPPETGQGRDFGHAMRTVWEKLEAMGAPEPRRAAFICALTLAWPDGHDETFLGRCQGHLVWPPRGDKGFGYDPMFVPAEHAVTFGEMQPDLKHAISHRADAFRQLVAACFGP
ncbi:MAG TPA: RdgB/HAM1 family non-canonical purine NTP pyrophosphatase [Thermohalobaculum sp.]|nr:RdgB/HAM1 family non-canonical purine NTP pyrophosphatase [Thermohalobaculum sp.]